MWQVYVQVKGTFLRVENIKNFTGVHKEPTLIRYIPNISWMLECHFRLKLLNVHIVVVLIYYR